MSSKKIRKVTCDSCGADFDRKLPDCPYCGATNLWGNERQYMEQLEETREQLRKLPEGRKRESRLVWKREATIVAVIIVVLLLIFGGIFLYSRQEEKAQTIQLKEMILNDM